MASFEWPDTDSPSLVNSFPPLWTINLHTGEGETKANVNGRVLDWLNQAYDWLTEESITRTETQKNNISRYKGYYRGAEPVAGGKRVEPSTPGGPRWPRIVVNHTQDLVEQKVAKLTRYKPTTDVVPASNEYGDKIDSIISKRVLESIKYRKDLEGFYARMVRRAILAGESYIYTFWNEHIGQEHPSSKAKRDKGERVPLIGKDNKQVKSEAGDVLYVDKPVRIGEVDYKLLHAMDVMLIPSPTVGQVPGVIIREWLHIDELRAQYPEKAHEITPTKNAQVFDMRLLDDCDLKDYCLKLTVFYRSSEFIDKGIYFTATPTCILDEVQDNPYEDIEGSEFGNIPIERLTDVDIETELHGYPSVNFINPLQIVYDKLTSLINKNISIFSHPKWVAQRNSYNPLTLGNESIILEHWGSSAPTLQSYQVVNADVFNYRNSIKDEMQMIFGIFSGSRGEAPAGARAANILYYYDEQESQRASNFLRKFNKLVVSVDKRTLSIAAKKYKNHDGRLLAIMGKDKTWVVETFDVKSLAKPQDIRVLSSSGLPDNKYARIETLLKLYQIAPQDPEVRTMVLEQIDFGQQEKFLDYARVAVMAAEAENEAFAEGKDVLPAVTYEEHLVHWTIHSKLMQSHSFKHLPQKTIELVKRHVKGHEEMMILKAQESEPFRMRLSAHHDFPLLSTVPVGGLLGAITPGDQGGQQLQAKPQAVPPPPTNGAGPPQGLQ